MLRLSEILALYIASVETSRIGEREKKKKSDKNVSQIAFNTFVDLTLMFYISCSIR